MDYEIQACTRHCHATGRELAPGEPFFSALVEEGATLARYDYAVEAWQGPPPGSVGWWKSQREASSKHSSGAPNDVVLDVFQRLDGDAAAEDMRYVLALFLIRRRVLRLEETEKDDQGREMWVVYCPRREATFRVAAVVPDEARVEPIQQELARLLD